MHPSHLNKFSNKDGTLPLPWDGKIRALAKLAWSKKPVSEATYDEIRSEFEIASIPDHPVAMFPPVTFSRLASQLGRFTIHPNNDEGRRITDLLGEPMSLTRYIVKKQVKTKIQFDLEALGFDYGTIFPDLDGLSKSLRDRLGRNSRGKLGPAPACGGRVAGEEELVEEPEEALEEGPECDDSD